MPGDIDVNKAAAVVLDGYKDVEEPKPRGDGNEEVTGNESPRVQAQERRPAQIASRPTSGMPRQVFPHRPGRDSDPGLPRSESTPKTMATALRTRQSCDIRGSDPLTPADRAFAEHSPI